jgi:hypothetical protein
MPVRRPLFMAADLPAFRRNPHAAALGAQAFMPGFSGYLAGTACPQSQRRFWSVAGRNATKAEVRNAGKAPD